MPRVLGPRGPAAATSDVQMILKEIRGKSMKYQCRLNARRGWLAALAGVLLCLSLGVRGTSGQGDAREARTPAPTTFEEEAIRRAAGVHVVPFRMFDTSLGVREQVDFLLTPALLVQEAVSDGVVLTYPEE
jgi:hypothetical protein